MIEHREDIVVAEAGVSAPSARSHVLRTVMQAIRAHEGLLSWVGFACIVTIFAAFAWHSPTSELFGFFHDDTVYLASAKALAEGDGYILPTFPGVLPQTKYPVLYPWVLSFIWRFSPEFPANLVWVRALSLGISGLYLLAVFLLVRRAKVGAVFALCVTSLIAFNPTFIALAGQALSDFLFAALLLFAAIAAEKLWTSSNRSYALAIAIGGLLASSLLVRTATVGAFAGVIAAGVMRRRWRDSVVILLTCLLLVTVIQVSVQRGQPSYVAPGAGVPPPGFKHLLLYYSNYLEFWRLSVPDFSTFRAMLWTNGRALVLAPGEYFIFESTVAGSRWLSAVFSSLISALCLGGVFRWFKRTGQTTVGWMLLGTAPVLLVWNYPLYSRFLIPFMPVFFIGAAVEVVNIIFLVRKAWSDRMVDRIVAALVIVLLASLAVIASFSWRAETRAIFSIAQRRSVVNRERQEAFAWIVRNTPRSARFFAYNDVNLGLHTGRRATRPIQASTDCYFKPERRCVSDYSELATFAPYLGTDFWLMCSDDLSFEAWQAQQQRVKEIIADRTARMKPVFVSSRGNAVIYDATCLRDPHNPLCSPEQPAIVP